MTAPALPSFPALDGLPVTQAHADQCARFGHATGCVDRCPRCGEAVEAPPVAEANLCGGTYVLAVTDPARPTGWRYEQCPGCVGCDYDTVAARSAQMTTEQAFARLPQIDEEAW